jgi:hypothetical protein
MSSNHQIQITGTDTRLALMEQSHQMLEEKLDKVYEDLDSRLTRVEDKVGDLSNQMKKGNAGLIKVIIGSTGTIVAAIASIIVALIQLQ